MRPIGVTPPVRPIMVRPPTTTRTSTFAGPTVIRAGVELRWTGGECWYEGTPQTGALFPSKRHVPPQLPMGWEHPDWPLAAAPCDAVQVGTPPWLLRLPAVPGRSLRACWGCVRRASVSAPQQQRQQQQRGSRVTLTRSTAASRRHARRCTPPCCGSGVSTGSRR